MTMTIKKVITHQIFAQEDKMLATPMIKIIIERVSGCYV